MESSGFVILGLVALVALILKLLILFNVELKTAIARSFAVLCLILLLQNVVEFLTYLTYLDSPRLGLFFINSYMLTLYFIPPAFLSLALRLSDSGYFLPLSSAGYAAAAMIAVAHVSGQVVAGYEFIGWTVISTPAPLYDAAILTIGATIFTAFGFLIHGIWGSGAPHIITRCKVCLLAFVPLALVFVVVTAARKLGFQSSAAVSMPVATVTFLFIMLHQTKDNLYWLSTKFRMVVALLFMDKNRTTEEVISALEDIRIRTALRTTGGVQKDAARLVCLPPSTLNKKIAKYGIDVKAYRLARSGSDTTTV